MGQDNDCIDSYCSQVNKSAGTCLSWISQQTCNSKGREKEREGRRGEEGRGGEGGKKGYKGAKRTCTSPAHQAFDCPSE